MKILHLEDNASDSILIERTLQRNGLEADVLCARSGEEFRSALDSGAFDVVLLDNGVPGFSGRAALQYSKVSKAEIPVIICSGAARDEDVATRLKEGASDYVLKDHLWQLVAALRRVEDSRSHHAAVEQDGGERLLKHNLAMSRLVGVVQELSLARDLSSIMKIVRRAARELTGADGATFVLRDGDHCFYADEDAISPLWKGQRFPLQACISGWTMMQGSSAVIEDIYVDPRIPIEAYRPTFVKSLAMVPIRSVNPIGAIGNYWARRHACTPDELMLLEALANTTAVAMENVRSLSELESRVGTRTQQLETANQELEAFSYAVSHDLRAPLRGMSSQMEMLADTLPPDATHSLARIDAARSHIRQMTSLIDDLLRLSRISQLELRVERFDLSAVATEVVNRMRAQEPQRQVEVKVEPGIEVRGDRALLGVALENLLSNAWKYSVHNAAARIEFGAATGDDGRRTYFVRDNGVGFDPHYADKLFQPFHRMHRQDEFPGTGVGLATVDRIVRRHGGEIRAESALGAGATFHFTLES
jgi:signal transduction histidine kinase/CheY-like chemotaxis protein